MYKVGAWLQRDGQGEKGFQLYSSYQWLLPRCLREQLCFLKQHVCTLWPSWLQYPRQTKSAIYVQCCLYHCQYHHDFDRSFEKHQNSLVFPQDNITIRRGVVHSYSASAHIPRYVYMTPSHVHGIVSKARFVAPYQCYHNKNDIMYQYYRHNHFIQPSYSCNSHRK